MYTRLHATLMSNDVEAVSVNAAFCVLYSPASLLHIARVGNHITGTGVHYQLTTWPFNPFAQSQQLTLCARAGKDVG